MVYKKLEEISEIRSYSIHPRGLFYVSAEFNLVYRSAVLQHGIESFYFIDEQYLFCYDTKNKCNYVYDISLDHWHSIPKEVALFNSPWKENQYLCELFTGDLYKMELMSWDILENRIIDHIGELPASTPYTYRNKIILCLPDNNISCYDTKLIPLWHFSLSCLGGVNYAPGKVDQVREILGVVHGRLWVYTDFGRLVALDIETGENVFVRNCFNSYLDEKTNNIHILSSNRFELLDTERLELLEMYDYKEVDPEGIGSYEAVYNPLHQGAYFTFIGEKFGDYSGTGWVGVFDYRSRRLVWEYEVIPQEEREKTGNCLIIPEQVQLSGDKLYVKDYHRTLHVFELAED